MGTSDDRRPAAEAGRADDDGGDMLVDAREFARLLGAYGDRCEEIREEAPALVYDLAEAAGDAVTAAYEAALAQLAEVTRERDEALKVLWEFADPDPCRFDHNGYCQAHFLDPAPCPVAEAKRLTSHLGPVTDDGAEP